MELNKIDALNMSLAQWSQWCVQNAKPAFVGKQILQWIYGRKSFCVNKNEPVPQRALHSIDPCSFSNVSPDLRQKLATEFSWNLPLVDTQISSEDQSEKILLKMHDGLFAESVLMPSENRITLCVSSQVGCRMACTFCQTGRMGLSRNLTAGEILGQILIANLILENRGINRRVTNVVFMGMGEPLDNYDNVVQACQIMIDPNLLGLSKHKVTVSTSGLVPEIKKLGQDVPVALAISLHTADDGQRTTMMPVNKKYPLADLKQALLEYPVQTRHGITFEYVMIEGVNDSLVHAKKLVKFLHGLKSKVNLIPMNPHPGNSMCATNSDNMRIFQKYLTDRSIPAPVRYSRGQDVSAACGQLAAKRKGELNLPPRIVALARRREFLDGRQRTGSETDLKLD